MINQLAGKLVDLSSQVATIDVQGVGYEVYCSTRCLASMELNSTVTVVVHTDVREDQIKLYGFLDRLEKQVFLLLTRVSGVGAKSASEIVSGIDAPTLLRTIAEGDAGRLQAIRGVGKKTAERIILELRDRVGAYALEQQPGGHAVHIAQAGPYNEATEGLVALGFSRNEAQRKINEVERLLAQGDAAARAADSAQIIREALRRS